MKKIFKSSEIPKINTGSNFNNLLEQGVPMMGAWEGMGVAEPTKPIGTAPKQQHPMQKQTQQPVMNKNTVQQPTQNMGQPQQVDKTVMTQNKLTSLGYDDKDVDDLYGYLSNKFSDIKDRDKNEVVAMALYKDPDLSQYKQGNLSTTTKAGLKIANVIRGIIGKEKLTGLDLQGDKNKKPALFSDFTTDTSGGEFASDVFGTAVTAPAKYLLNTAKFLTGLVDDEAGDYLGSLVGDLEEGVKKEIGTDKDSFTSQATQFLSDIAIGMPIGLGVTKVVGAGVKGGSQMIKATKGMQDFIQKYPTVTNALSKVSPVFGKALRFGAEGALDGVAYDIISQGDVTLDNALIGGGIGAGFPIAGKVLMGGKKLLGRMFGKKAEEFAVKGILNVADARKVVNQLEETGDGDASSIGRWMLEKKVVGGDEKTVVAKLRVIKDYAYKEVRKVIKGMTDTFENIDGLEEGAGIIKKRIAVVRKLGSDSIYAKELDSMEKILSNIKNGKVTLQDAQTMKETLDTIFPRAYKTSGEVGSSNIAEVVDEIRGKIRKQIEVEVERVAPGTNIRSLNRDVQVATTLENAIKTKSVANDLKQFVLQGVIGGGLGGGTEGFDLTNPSTYVRILIGTLVGRQIGKLLSSPGFNGKVATMLDNLSATDRKNLIEYTKSPRSKPLNKTTEVKLETIKKEMINTKEVSDIIDGDITDIPNAGSDIIDGVPTGLPKGPKGDNPAGSDV